MALDDAPFSAPAIATNVGLTVITTHLNADYDAIASMLAAQKLYPGALVIFPGSQEKNLRNFFIQSMVYLYNIAEMKDIDFNQVKRLVLVDTCRADRIGKMAEILDNKDLVVHTYDHHPPKPDDIQGEVAVNRMTGANVTIMTEILRERQITITAEEATIMCLGIYEDTGSFTFSSTTAQDLQAAAYLFTRGANIHVVASMISREISPEQISYLNDLIQSSVRRVINGVEVVIASVHFDRYLPDFAFLVHKMMKMESIHAIFALAMMENKVHIVGRSSTDEVDVGDILGALGGGGHASAASASIKGEALTQVEQSLLQELHRQIKPRRLARHLMSSPAITADLNIPCAQGNQLLTRYNINALLVTATEQGKTTLVGYITRQVIEKAIYHDLGDLPIKDYMNTEMASVGPQAGVLEVQEKIIGHKQRILPVMDGDRILGAITRTDLLTVLVQQNQSTRGHMPDPTRQTLHARTRNVLHFMQERLSLRILDTLRQMGQIAQQLAFEAYVVGGFVRDLFLYRANEDVDVVIEGDGIAFAKAYAQEYGVRLHLHKKFGTAVMIFPDGFKIDVATARMEYYRSPAALPDVEMSSIKLDLFRRDFTINTLAINLNPGKFGRLIDFFSAQRDLKDRVVRVLHNLSFVEDPTRVFRALRFEQRFGFGIGKLTANLIANAVKMDFFKRLSGRRVFSELRQICEEENPAAAIRRMADFDLLKVIHPSVVFNKELAALLDNVKSVLAWHDLMFMEEPCQRWTLYFMAMIRNCDLSTSEEICRNLELSPRMAKLLCQERIAAQNRLCRLEMRLPEKASELYAHLRHFRTEMILFMMASTERKSVQKAISNYFIELRKIEPLTSGQDLIAMGLTPGPFFKAILEAVLDAKLNKEVDSREDELDFIRAMVRKSAPAVHGRAI
jgi:tRNA nucleotidyltransferase (CCA-adding enzyme)